MSRRRGDDRKHRSGTLRRQRLLPRATRNALELGQRARGAPARERSAFVPPEEWHEPSGDSSSDYRIVVRDPGPGYVHVVTPRQIRRRLAELPRELTAPLEVIHLGRMTRKKLALPCYGMQWGRTIYLYPLQANLVEHYTRPPRPAEYNEARMCGGRWVQRGSTWKLIWSEESVRRFYLDNVLIHELGHLLDDRNTNHRDRERFADWFAIRHGRRKLR